jgi:hypothetical protein
VRTRDMPPLVDVCRRDRRAPAAADMGGVVRRGGRQPVGLSSRRVNPGVPRAPPQLQWNDSRGSSPSSKDVDLEKVCAFRPGPADH